MSIGFNEIPGNFRVPGVYIEIDNSLANNASDQQEVVIIGSLGTDGDTAINTLTRITLPDDAAARFGTDSPVYAMAKWFYAQNKVLPMSAVATDATTPDISAALAAIGDKQFHYVISQHNDDTAFNLYDTDMTERYSALKQIPGMVWMAKKDTHAGLVTTGTSKNTPFVTMLGINSLVDAEGTALEDYEVAAAYAGVASYALSIDPVRPLQTLELAGVYTNAGTEWTATPERNLLLFSGISTYRTNNAGQVFIERAITTYQENNAGAADDSYLDVETVYAAMWFRAKQRNRIMTKFPRHKLAKDGTNFAPGQPIVTPSIIKGELMALYRELEYDGIVQDFDAYKKSLIVEIDPNDPNRINDQDQPMFINGLVIYAGKVMFRKN